MKGEKLRLHNICTERENECCIFRIFIKRRRIQENSLYYRLSMLDALFLFGQFDSLKEAIKGPSPEEQAKAQRLR